MIKKPFVLLLSLVALILGSCSGESFRTFLLNKNSDDNKADRRMDEILTAIEKKDRITLKSAFSKQALVQSSTIEEDVETLFKALKGPVTAKERTALIVNESNDYGDKIRDVVSFYKFSTKTDQYLAFILEYTAHTVKPENVGVYSLRIIRAADEKSQFGSWQDMKVPGIYRPGK